MAQMGNIAGLTGMQGIPTSGSRFSALGGENLPTAPASSQVASVAEPTAAAGSRAQSLAAAQAMAYAQWMQAQQQRVGSAGALHWSDLSCKQRMAEVMGRMQGPSELHERLLCLDLDEERGR